MAYSVQHLLHGVLKEYRDVLRVSSKWGWSFTENGSGRVHDRTLLEGIQPAEHLIDNHTKREDVGPSVHLLTTDLLWGHLGNRA